MEDYTGKYKGEQVEVALFGGEYQEGVLTAYCSFEDVPHPGAQTIECPFQLLQHANPPPQVALTHAERFERRLHAIPTLGEVVACGVE